MAEAQSAPQRGEEASVFGFVPDVPGLGLDGSAARPAAGVREADVAAPATLSCGEAAAIAALVDTFAARVDVLRLLRAAAAAQGVDPLWLDTPPSAPAAGAAPAGAGVASPPLLPSPARAGAGAEAVLLERSSIEAGAVAEGASCGA